MIGKLKSGERLPDITMPQLGGGELRLGLPPEHHDWQMVVVYRGKHCPICKTYLAELERLAKGLKFIHDNDYPIRGRLAA